MDRSYAVSSGAVHHNPTRRAHTAEHIMSGALAVCVVVLLGLLVLTMSTSPSPMPAVLIIAGLVFLCFFYSYVFVLPDDLSATATDRTLAIASMLFEYAREGLTSDSMAGACRIILPETLANAICITDGSTIVASAGEGSDSLGAGSAVKLDITHTVMETAEASMFTNDSTRIERGFPVDIHAGLVAPLRVGETCMGTLELYYRRSSQIDQRQMALVSGFAELLSAQLATFELERQSEISARVELKALQSQVDPHFLFNTLSTIVSVVRTNPEQARRLIIDFSDYYRQTLSDSDKPVTLRQEIEQGERYMNLMQARYGADRLIISTDIEDAAADQLVPPFIVQPLLENSVKHGMREVGALTIKLHAAATEDGCIITVEDDGVGMDEATRAALFDNTRPTTHKDGKGTGLAMNNVLQRIHFFFGPEAHIDVASTPNVGTKVSVYLVGERTDMQIGASSHVEHTHR